jgi:hypothetical protein
MSERTIYRATGDPSCAECGSTGPKWSHLQEVDDGVWICKHVRACEARQMIALGTPVAEAAAHAQGLKTVRP